MIPPRRRRKTRRASRLGAMPGRRTAQLGCRCDGHRNGRWPVHGNLRRAATGALLIGWLTLVALLARSRYAEDDLRWRDASGSMLSVAVSEGRMVVARKQHVQRGLYNLAKAPVGWSYAVGPPCDFKEHPVGAVGPPSDFKEYRAGLDRFRPMSGSGGIGGWTFIVYRRRWSFAGVVWETGATVITEAIRMWGPKPMPPTDCWFLLVPLWPVLLVGSLWSGMLLVRGIRHERRRMQNRCTTCGYDLRASPGRCPECGTPRAERPA
jgi:hypothetical protein